MFKPYTPLDVAAIILALIHFGVPLAYYWYMKTKYLNKPWNIKINPNYKPKVTIIVPTYNEAKLIWKKLDNIAEQTYPQKLVEIIIIDSASTDGTPEIVKKWAAYNSRSNLKLLIEKERRGMVPALNYALEYVSKESSIVLFTDVDAIWGPNTLTDIIKYFADNNVGTVTATLLPLSDREDEEHTYRNYFGSLRLAESKLHSTPIHNGALIAFRRNLLVKIGKLPTYTGNNDSTPASIIAFMGYRAIQADDVTVKENLKEKYLSRKVRRAQHLILHFLYTKSYVKKMNIYKKTLFDKIWSIEYYLHIINPWILIASAILILLSLLMRSLTSMALLILGLCLFTNKQYRVWILTQACLILAFIKNFKSKNIMWEK